MSHVNKVFGTKDRIINDKKFIENSQYQDIFY